MTFVTARDLRLHPAAVWGRLAKAHEVVITLKGRPIGILAKATEEEVEEILQAFRRARAAAAIARLRAEAEVSGASQMTVSEINREVRAVRRSRRAA
ncbi:MAG: hypothetical protein HY600_03135 [Candidatus Omnitrophica bacterium]|nr:hypothetical protein [Candidatus Omnitrophota bacterium]